MTDDRRLREMRPTRGVGQPTGNKHKAHRAAISSKKCTAYLSRGQRIKNRDRRLARIKRGLSGLIGGKRRNREYERRHAHA